MLVVGLTGASLITVGLLQKRGIQLNEDMIKITLTCATYGGLLYILKIASKLFLPL
ncbi:MAG: hypothetical protein ACI35O_08075 [Bacillaceae bacterium]